MKKIIILLIIFLSFPLLLTSQEIEANVIVNMEMLDMEARVHVGNMEDDVRTYLNNQKFSDKDWEGPPIPVDVNIILSSGGGTRYDAKLFIIAKRYIYGQDGGTSINIKFADDQWSFEYQRGAFFTYDRNIFHPFSSILDFYMLLIIGLELDTYTELEGNSAYQTARQILTNGATRGAKGFDTRVEPGAYSKYALVTELLDLRFEALRRLFFEYYVDGLDYMAENETEAKENLRYVIADIADFKKNKMVSSSVILQAFFDSKAHELGTIFKGYEDQTVFKDLMYIDPSNTTIYERYMN